MQNITINLHSTFLSSEFIGTLFIRFVCIVFITFTDTLFVKYVISSHAITESSTTRFNYLLFSQRHMLEFQP